MIFAQVCWGIKMWKICYKRLWICREQQCELHLWQMCVIWIEIEAEDLFIFVYSKRVIIREFPLSPARSSPCHRILTAHQPWTQERRRKTEVKVKNPKPKQHLKNVWWWISRNGNRICNYSFITREINSTNMTSNMFSSSQQNPANAIFETLKDQTNELMLKNILESLLQPLYRRISAPEKQNEV